ncbi:unnamed protein product [Brassicogethes aeneus]|uniref:Uncharacterized protein n=1 Tax=Brassicogethes aeneus TaxID=1431903 RepID=A0A9P0FCJ1_BRAAE|nr:unnamed protein product [Brassicogethes aeneus]
MALIDVFGMTIPATMAANIGDDIISYLFRYPTTILKPQEAAQVELLIFTLTALKPKLVASRVFNVEVSLIASEDTQTTGAFVSVVIISMCLIDVFGMTIPATMAANIGDDIISYLFRYPTTILKPQEAAQVELLIFTLTALKPKLVASRVFNVEVSLIASISGAVVTYILVALQLHQAFIKNLKNIEAERN